MTPREVGPTTAGDANKLNTGLGKWEQPLQTTLSIPSSFTTAISKYIKINYKTQLVGKLIPCYSQSMENCIHSHRCSSHLKSYPSTSNFANPIASMQQQWCLQENYTTYKVFFLLSKAIDIILHILQKITLFFLIIQKFRTLVLFFLHGTTI